MLPAITAPAPPPPDDEEHPLPDERARLLELATVLRLYGVRVVKRGTRRSDGTAGRCRMKGGC